jgi:hypothetical protein
MRRRDFITLLGGATTWPFAAHSQPAGKLPIIGLLGAATPATWNPWTSAFEKRLSELGWNASYPRQRLTLVNDLSARR